MILTDKELVTMPENSRYVKELLAKDSSKLTRSEKYYLEWIGATGPGALLKTLLVAKERAKEDVCISK